MHISVEKFGTNQSQETQLFPFSPRFNATMPSPLPTLMRDRSCGEQCLGLGTVLPSSTFLGPLSYTVNTLKGALGVQRHQSVSLSVHSRFPLRIRAKTA